MPEYLRYRCCMCPRERAAPPDTLAAVVCPPYALTGKGPTPCRFVRRYIDKLGVRYRVAAARTDKDGSRYTVFEMDGSGLGWHPSRRFCWRRSFDDSQRSLNEVAGDSGWAEWEPDIPLM